MLTLGNFSSFMGIRYPEINNKRESERGEDSDRFTRNLTG